MKLKLLRVSGNALAQFGDFGTAILDDVYSEEKEIGFSIARVSRNSIHGRFLERKARRVQVLAANGEPSVVEVPSIGIVEFELYARERFLVVYDLSGAISPFVSRLGMLSKHSISIELESLPIQTWMHFFERAGYTFSATEVTTAHVPLQDDVEATVRLRGNVEVSVLTSGLFMGMRGEVINAQLHCVREDAEFIFTWKNSGTYEIDPAPTDEGMVHSLLSFLNASGD